jgi:homoserine dehydrogenase
MIRENDDMATVRVGLLGCGNVGAPLTQLLDDNADLIARRAGVRLEVTRVAVHNLAKEREVTFAEGVLTNDAQSVVDDPDVDIVVEVIGGVEPARSLLLSALKAGKPVVTANKELLANFGEELFEAAQTSGVDVLFEASVAGGIPLMRPLRESLAGERIRRVMGIVNGTTNYILTQMSEEGSTFGDALAEAQRLGFAERDPTADIEGFDAAAKAAIIASIAFGARVVAGDVYREGISNITSDDIAAAHELGYVVKLLAIAEEVDGQVGVRVHPAMVPLDHPRRRGRTTHAARARRGRWTHGQCGRRRPRRRGQEPALGIARRDDRHAATDADPAGRRNRIAVLPVARRRRPARCARGDRGRVRGPRSVDPVDAAEGPSRRGPSDIRDAPRA